MRLAFGLLLVALAGAALAHDGVKNPAVMARMHGMKSIGAEMKTLGQMAKGAVSFDAAAARAAAEKVAVEATRIEALFEAQEDDPKSEALPTVWADFPNFVAKSKELQAAADQASTVKTLDDLQASLRDIGATCSGCHKAYRKP